ncbi:hypothetical protein [Burkholderia sp. 4M9327F10]|uniref:hypothetical protein n=1 Tax=Burkholderia sp. 4M9327F10 TaxID=2502223 RepID=UPI000ADBBF6A|nr:hypothetical protein [Burkholderia sp. 4M9327F10]MBA9847871.1 hypothetical protein [Ralstonia pickettii]MBA9853445.1 hypothetical protein [Ralstonia pickettii]MBA9920924.1 hypothetical protein [Ralstonia pickettii]MBA9960749.1 hypothetical protein [Ralstonia pickettii]MBA9984372.1 hypothetical protein [Ralstonia pickettii]
MATATMTVMDDAGWPALRLSRARARTATKSLAGAAIDDAVWRGGCEVTIAGLFRMVEPGACA